MTFKKLLSALLIASMVPAFAQAQDEEVQKVSGFVDAQFVMPHGLLEETGVAGERNTFTVNQAALYFQDRFEGGFVFADLAIMSTGVGVYGYSEALSQLYVGNQYDMGLSWQLGQWDTIFGNEPNDTVHLPFAQHGLIFNLRPKTHTGLLVDYEVSGIHVRVMAGNSMQNLDHNTSPADSSMEMGAQVMWENEMINARLGILQNSVEDVGDEQLMDLGVGVKMGVFSAEVGYITVAEFGANETNEEDVTGLHLEVAFAPEGAEQSYHLRYQAVEHFTTTPAGSAYSADASQSLISLGVNHNFNERFVAKLQIDMGNIENAAGDSDSYTEGFLGAVYRF